MDFIKSTGLQLSVLKPVRPWSDFFQTASFRKPSNWTEVQSRFQHNLKYFQSNYLLILAAFLVFCLLTNILFLLAFVASAAALHYIARLPEDFAYALGSLELRAKHLQAGWAVASLVLLYLTSAGTAIFWSIGVASVVAGTHAVMHDVSIESDFALPA